MRARHAQANCSHGQRAVLRRHPFQCTPAALAQPGGFALGAQAGPAAVQKLAEDAGFSRFRQVTQTPVNVVLELQP